MVNLDGSETWVLNRAAKISRRSGHIFGQRGYRLSCTFRLEQEVDRHVTTWNEPLRLSNLLNLALLVFVFFGFIVTDRFPDDLMVLVISMVSATIVITVVANLTFFTTSFENLATSIS